jgi:hypothetical protein
MHALQAQPDGLPSRRVRAPAIHVPAELGDHPHHLAERGRLARRRFVLHHAVHSFPFRRFKERFATDVRAAASQAAYIERPPGDDQIHRQAPQLSVDVVEASLFRTTAGS